MYSILTDEPLDESAEETNPNESKLQPKEPLHVVYNGKVAPDFLDFVIIYECPPPHLQPLARVVEEVPSL